MTRLRAAAADVERNTRGRVKFKSYAGGIMGSHQSVLRKIRIGQLHGGVVTAGSLANIHSATVVYGLPLLFRSLAGGGLRARPGRCARLPLELEASGFASFGFAYMMSNRPLRSIADLKGQKVWLPSGDAVTGEVLEVAGVWRPWRCRSRMCSPACRPG